MYTFVQYIVVNEVISNINILVCKYYYIEFYLHFSINFGRNILLFLVLKTPKTKRIR